MSIKKVLKQQTLDGEKVKEYVSIIEDNKRIFQQALKNRFTLGYKFFIYKLNSKLGHFKDLPYIGYTQNKIKRIRRHLINAIGPHGESFGYVNVVPIHMAIIEVIKFKNNIEIIQNEINKLIYPEKVIIQNKDDIYCWLSDHNNRSEFIQIMNFLMTSS